MKARVRSYRLRKHSSFAQRCFVVRHTSISLNMSYEQRFRILKLRYGL